MTQGRADVVAWLRRVLPLWLVWPLYAVPVVFLLFVVRLALLETSIPFDGATTTYDESGNLVPNDSVEQPTLVVRAASALLFSVANTVSPVTPLIALLLGVGLLFAHGAPDASWRHRAAAAGGLLASASLVVIDLLPALSYPSLATRIGDVGRSVLPGLLFAAVEFAAVGFVAAIAGWVCLRLVRDRDPLPLLESAEGLDTPDPGEPARPEGDTCGPADDGRRVGAAASVPDPVTADDWDSRPELPPDFRAPAAGSSIFERPAAAHPVVEAEVDPDAVYRRPQPAD